MYISDVFLFNNCNAGQLKPKNQTNYYLQFIKTTSSFNMDFYVTSLFPNFTPVQCRSYKMMTGQAHIKFLGGKHRSISFASIQAFDKFMYIYLQAMSSNYSIITFFCVVFNQVSEIINATMK